ncbi:solute carrier family 15 member 5-like [Sinocyclocheilus grahami]|uniref:solute carrier family 15 member 5-like n=1 Tax=Sinocyclocheilus grahami TaxID=75366 RepID=UPI0007AC8698|nr:PREDICTED: solute carrier family 15 member 5-like [Sinocyclocheilus grahami]
MITFKAVINAISCPSSTGSSLLTTLGVFLSSLKMCCLHYRHLSGDVANWLDRAKENNGGRYSETSVENVKILVKLFPLFGLQLLYRACITQIPSGYYLQTMHSNLKLNGFLLPVAVMKVISILPVLILAPLLELLNTCYQSPKKILPSPATFISSSLLTTLGVFLSSLKMCCLHYRHLSGDVANWLDRAKENNGGRYSETSVENVKILVKLFPLFGLQLLYRACITQIPSGYYLQTMHSNLKLNGFLLPVAVMKVISILPVLILAPLLELLNTCYQSPKKILPSPATFIIMGHACAALSALLAGISEIHRKNYPQVEQTLSGKVLHVSSMTCFQLTPQYILLGVAEAFVTPACSLISFCLTPSNLRGVSLHFLTLSYGGGCFLGAFLVHFLYFVSGGNFYPNNLSSGNMERFFFTLATLMAINTLVFWRISQRYTDLSVELSSGAGHSHLYEKLLQYKTCLRFYDTLDRSDTLTSMETVL